MDKKKKYRRRIRRKIIWDRHGNQLKFWCMIAAGLLALAAAFIWRAAANQREAAEVAKRLAAMPAGEAYSQSICKSFPDKIPEYSGEDFVILNGGIPCFNLYDVKNMEGESYSELDGLGRCGPAMAMLHKSMMPTVARESIGEIRPTGWVQQKYEGIVDSAPPYLYNRCHLIAYALTGQNANEKNLITGTRYFNAEAMLPWELKVMRYLESCDNHVLYRVTPFFSGDELLARGVEMEAYSVEDAGRELCFHVFVYNVQPGIELDYATGENRVKK